MNHRWTDQGSKLPPDTVSGCEEHERVCELCSLTKITIHYYAGHPGRAWRTRDGERWEGMATPPCLPQQVEEVRAI